jgi:hypothetical protein
MKIEQQAKLWRYAAWTSPFTALALLLGETLIGFNTLTHITSIIVVVAFITTSVFWWWWALSKLVRMLKTSEKIEQDFTLLIKELKEIKKDVGDRQWREPNND